jgi:hypothetical protein
MNQEQILQWQGRVERAQTLQNERTKERREILKLYVGEFFGKPTDNTGEVTEVNFVFEFVKVLVGAIYAKDPHIFVRARVKSRHQFAETMERVINYYWKELELKGKIKQSILDGVLQPPGFIELGFLFLKEVKDDFAREIEDEFPELKSMEPLETQGIFDDTVKEDDIFANYLSSWNVLWPDGYHNIKDCPYMIIKEDKSLADIMANPMYKAVKNQLPGNVRSSATQNPNDFKFTMKTTVTGSQANTNDGLDDELINVRLYHIFDKRSQARFVIAEGFNEDTLFEREWKYLPEGFPIFDLIFNEIPQTDERANSYPLSDVVPMLPQLKELSKISSAMMRHRKRAGTILLGRKDVISETDAAKIQNAGDVDLILLDSIKDDDVKGFTPPSLPQDFYRLRGIILEDLMRISGFQQLLANVGGVETATESENVRAGALLRQSEKVDIIEDYTVRIARYMAGLLWNFKTRKQIEEILDEPVSQEMWPDLPKDAEGNVEVNKARRIIQKEINFDIEAGSTKPPKDENVERKLWIDLVNIVKTQFPGRLNDSVILPQLLKKFDFKDIDQAVIGFDEEEAQVAGQENQLLLQGVPVPVSPNQNHKIHLQVHAQAANQGQTSPALDQHLLKHAEFEERNNPNSGGGGGSAKAQAKPSLVGQRGVPENVDLVGSLKQRVSGSNQGRG